MKKTVFLAHSTLRGTLMDRKLLSRLRGILQKLYKKYLSQANFVFMVNIAGRLKKLRFETRHGSISSVSLQVW